MDSPLTCPDCNGSMEPGFVLDCYDHDTYRPASWHPGIPKYPKILGRWVEKRVVCVDREAVLPITTYRCLNCGLLKSYAGKVD